MYENKTKIILLLIILSIIFSVFTIFISSASLNVPSVSAKSAVLYEPETKQFIYEKNADAKLGIASTTKIMTALLAIENLPLDQVIEADSSAVGIEGSSMYLELGEQLTVLDLIYGLMLNSANDAAMVLANAVSGDVEKFAELMNEKAKSLGAENTNFANPNGLDDKNHYSTARDLSLITAYALENDTFREVVSTKKITVQSNLKERLLVNHNKLLKNYSGCIGVKTGFTKTCGRCLVSAANVEGLELICVTVNAPDDWRDHTNLLDYGYSILESVSLAKIGQFQYTVPVIDGDHETIDIENTEELSIIRNKGGSEITAKTEIPQYIVAPVYEGDVIGKVSFYENGEKIGEVDLKAKTSIIKKEKKGIFNFFFNLIK